MTYAYAEHEGDEMAKRRLDQYLVDQGLVKTRSMAQSMIMAGEVYVNGQKAAKAGEMIKGDETIDIKSKSAKFVSRGGLKLDKAIKAFDIKLDGCICMDIGASTGGFTDCMLQNGAKKVYSIDVGYGQLAWKLRGDERVVNMERTNFRYVTKEQIPDEIDFFSVDVSFISLKLILPPAYDLLKNGGRAVCLIKPQFEAGREKVGKKGVVRDKKVHIEVIENVLSFTREIGFSVVGLDFSPIKGPEGNIEYLMYISKTDDSESGIAEFNIEKLVENSHELDKMA